ncbi:nitrogen permease regulator 2 [Gonapodya prolifera JEL478]|uniref:Nitrogen permease regulator 2 n=1 Tax=Gonapodya prolifera (strain JEL478) TaxID=1344416 RepID=A0A139AT05_GONPJ|nr:nitrogen permease regulator 2 [Gonapodya prolifera JEL478]|eukprot:KXS19849.1 nitrogen permease regulator 2 [Gonapodya prolifera JEL478]
MSSVRPRTHDVKFSRIACLVYCEFHHTEGSKIVYQIPEGFLTAGSSRIDFDQLSDVLIPKPELAHRLYVYRFSGAVTVASWPCVVEDARYPRNKFLWNLGFIFEGSGEGVVSYEQVIRKLGRNLRALEVESQFLSNPSTKRRLPQILEQIMEDLNAYHECQVTLDPVTTISLKLFPMYPDPAPIDEWAVPVVVMPGAWGAADASWDLTLLKIFPYINGVWSMSRIAQECDVDIKLCGIALQHLVYYGIVALADIFQYSNVYATTPSLRLLLDPKTGLAIRCARVVAERTIAGLTPGVLMGLYAGMRHGLTVKQWAKNVGIGHRVKVDVRRFVLFGVLNGLIRRVHRYPVLVQIAQTEQQPTSATLATPTTMNLSLLDGNHHCDELCTNFHVGPKRLDELCDALCRWLNPSANAGKGGDGMLWRVRMVWR